MVRFPALIAAAAALPLAILGPMRPLPVSRADGALAYTCEALPAAAPVDTSFTAHDGTDPEAADAVAALREAARSRAPGWSGRWAGALAVMRTVAPGSLSLADRLLAQGAAFQMALALADEMHPRKLSSELTGSRLAGALRDEALALVDRLALPAEAFAAMGTSPDPAVETWLGPRASWTERTTALCGEGPLFHETVNRGALAFHPFRAGPTRALLAQIVGFDRARRAHVTPLVATIEMRRGLGVRAPVCVVELDARHRTLATVAHAALERSTFIRPAAHGGIRCNDCHASETAFGAADVADPAAAAALADARRALVVAFATTSLFDAAR